MKKIFFFIIFMSSIIYCYSQTDIKISILTDDGIVTVCKTNKGNDVISFPVSKWDLISAGTKFSSRNIINEKPIHVYIGIASKKSCCKSGIGFSCSIFDCPFKRGILPISINNENRICAAMLERRDAYTISLIFIDRINWKSLEQD